jgi:hypothetical protein
MGGLEKLNGENCFSENKEQIEINELLSSLTDFTNEKVKNTLSLEKLKKSIIKKSPANNFALNLELSLNSILNRENPKSFQVFLEIFQDFFSDYLSFPLFEFKDELKNLLKKPQGGSLILSMPSFSNKKTFNRNLKITLFQDGETLKIEDNVDVNNDEVFCFPPKISFSEDEEEIKFNLEQDSDNLKQKIVCYNYFKNKKNTETTGVQYGLVVFNKKTKKIEVLQKKFLDKLPKILEEQTFDQEYFYGQEKDFKGKIFAPNSFLVLDKAGFDGELKIKEITANNLQIDHQKNLDFQKLNNSLAQIRFAFDTLLENFKEQKSLIEILKNNQTEIIKFCLNKVFLSYKNYTVKDLQKFLILAIKNIQAGKKLPENKSKKIISAQKIQAQSIVNINSQTVFNKDLSLDYQQDYLLEAQSLVLQTELRNSNLYCDNLKNKIQAKDFLFKSSSVKARSVEIKNAVLQGKNNVFLDLSYQNNKKEEIKKEILIEEQNQLDLKKDLEDLKIKKSQTEEKIKKLTSLSPIVRRVFNDLLKTNEQNKILNLLTDIKIFYSDKKVQAKIMKSLILLSQEKKYQAKTEIILQKKIQETFNNISELKNNLQTLNTPNLNITGEIMENSVLNIFYQGKSISIKGPQKLSLGFLKEKTKTLF